MKTCSFHDGSRDCPAPGVYIIDGGPWYCHWHSPHNKFEDNRRILDDLLQNGVPKLKDWHDQMVDLTMRGVSMEDARKQVFGKHEGI